MITSLEYGPVCDRDTKLEKRSAISHQQGNWPFCSELKWWLKAKRSSGDSSFVLRRWTLDIQSPTADSIARIGRQMGNEETHASLGSECFRGWKLMEGGSQNQDHSVGNKLLSVR